MKESQLHQAFAKWLNSVGVPFVHSRTDRKTSTTVGDPDFFCFWCSHVVAIEIKVGKNKLSPAQEKRIAYLRKAGNKVAICYSLQECVEAARGILCQGDDKYEPGEAKLARLRAIRDELDAPLEPEPATQNTAEGQKESPSEPAPDSMTPAFFTPAPHQNNLFIANVFGTDWVMAGESFAGGLASMVRRPTPEDIRSLPRK